MHNLRLIQRRFIARYPTISMLLFLIILAALVLGIGMLFVR
jgi:hypothetical protein